MRLPNRYPERSQHREGSCRPTIQHRYYFLSVLPSMIFPTLLRRQQFLHRQDLERSLQLFAWKKYHRSVPVFFRVHLFECPIKYLCNHLPVLHRQVSNRSVFSCRSPVHIQWLTSTITKRQMICERVFSSITKHYFVR